MKWKLLRRKDGNGSVGEAMRYKVEAEEGGGCCKKDWRWKDRKGLVL